MHRFLTHTAARCPDRTAVCQGGREFTYAAVAEKARGVAAALGDVPISDRDRVVIAFGNGIAFMAAYFGVLTAGGIPVLIRPDTPPAEVAAVIEDAEAAGIMGHARVFRALPERAPRLKAAFLDGPLPAALSGIPLYRNTNEPAAFPAGREAGADGGVAAPTIIYTSGTSGPPKGVVLPPESLWFSTGVMVDYLRLTAADRSMAGIPFSHCAGLLHMLAHIRCAGSQVTGESPAFPGAFLGAVLHRRVTGLPVVPCLMRRLVSGYPQGVRRYCARLRYIELSSEPCDGALVDRLGELLPEVSLYNTYGLTEAPRATYHDIRGPGGGAASVGRPNPGVAVRIVDARGGDCGPGAVGEIHVSGPNVAAGYWRRPEKTAAAFTETGFRTGDLAWRDAAGRIHLKGRIDKRVKLNGEWVSSEESASAVS